MRVDIRLHGQRTSPKIASAICPFQRLPPRELGYVGKRWGRSILKFHKAREAVA